MIQLLIKKNTKSKSKRAKLNEDSKNQRITDWIVEKKPKRKEKDENKLVERVNKNETEEGMNIDNESSHIKNHLLRNSYR